MLKHSPDSTNYLDGKGSNSNPTSPRITSPSIQKQIMDIVNSTTAPKDQPYYIIINQGQPNEQTYLIQPNGQNPGISSVCEVLCVPS